MNIFQQISQLKSRVDQLAAQLSSVSTPAGKLRITTNNYVGGIWPHTHESESQGGVPGYSPSTTSSWNGNQDPGDIWDALDQLSLRIKALETLLTGYQPTYGASTMLFTGMEV